MVTPSLFVQFHLSNYQVRQKHLKNSKRKQNMVSKHLGDGKKIRDII